MILRTENSVTQSKMSHPCLERTQVTFRARVLPAPVFSTNCCWLSPLPLHLPLPPALSRLGGIHPPVCNQWQWHSETGAGDMTPVN